MGEKKFVINSLKLVEYSKKYKIFKSAFICISQPTLLIFILKLISNYTILKCITAWDWQSAETNN